LTVFCLDVYVVSATYESEGLKERGKRQIAPITSPDDDLDPEELEEQISEQIRIETKGKPSKYEAVLRRDFMRKKMKENETGREITLSLLAKGVDPGPGRILHITPDLLDSGETDPSMMVQEEDLWSSSGRDSMAERKGMKGSMDLFGHDMGSKENSMLEGLGLEDDDAELQAFMKAIEGGEDGELSFEEFMKNADSSLFNEQEAADAENDKDISVGSGGGSKGGGRVRKERSRARASGGQDRGMRDLLRGMGEEGLDVEAKLDAFTRGITDDISEDKLRLIEELEKDMTSGRFDPDKFDIGNYRESEDKPSDNDFRLKDKGERTDSDDEVLVKKKEKKTGGIVGKKHPAVHRNPLLALLDNEPLPPAPEPEEAPDDLSKPARDENGIVTRDEVDRQWDQVLFGRCPDPDYSEPIHVRRNKNISRAKGLYLDMLERGVEPDTDTLTAFMSVYSEANRMEGALDVIDKFASAHQIEPTESTYHRLIRCHIFLKDIGGAQARLEEMKERGLEPSRETYGLLIQSLSNRDSLVEALHLLEESTAKGLKISNTYIKKLRARCAKLGVDHPDVYPDPHLWVKEVKDVRKKSKNFPPGNKVHFMRSLTFS
jgi:pentatricopeptide repeat protein